MVVSDEFRKKELAFIGKQHSKPLYNTTFVETIPKKVQICVCGIAKGSHQSVPRFNTNKDSVVCSKFVLHHVELKHYRRRERYHPMITEVA